MFAEYNYQSTPRKNEMSILTGLKIGFFQVLALVPGMSRSGATIGGGMLLGLSRFEAARFAFLLSIPIITGAGLKKLLELIVSDESIVLLPLVVGSAVSFITSLIAIHFLLTFVRSHTLWPFIWYRIILASFVLFVFFRCPRTLNCASASSCAQFKVQRNFGTAQTHTHLYLFQNLNFVPNFTHQT
jgi:undecaprenyl pyrophosphate phosphatase UppP